MLLSSIVLSWILIHRNWSITKSSNSKPVIGHPRDSAPMTWEIGGRRTNYGREFFYRCDWYYSSSVTSRCQQFLAWKRNLVQSPQNLREFPSLLIFICKGENIKSNICLAKIWEIEWPLSIFEQVLILFINEILFKYVHEVKRLSWCMTGRKTVTCPHQGIQNRLVNTPRSINILKLAARRSRQNCTF